VLGAPHPSMQKTHTKRTKWQTESLQISIEKGIKYITKVKLKPVHHKTQDRTQLINPNSIRTEKSTLPSEESTTHQTPSEGKAP
jgi:hypothetical protein